MSWLPHDKLEITGDIQMIHCDTRDFHCSLVAESHKHHSNNEKLLFTTEEVLSLLARMYEESGGKRERDWRWICFIDEKAEMFGGDWQFKYMRFFRVAKDAWICKPTEDLRPIEKSFFEDKKCFGDIWEANKYRKELGWVEPEPEPAHMHPNHPDSYIIYEGGHHHYAPTSKPAQYVRDEKKVQRNEPCPCGSGKKYKKCCL